MKHTAQPIIIVKKIKKGHGGHHGGAWKVAYADFVTAMMAFFLVMWLAAQDSQIRTAVAGYFQEPGLLPHQQSNGIVASGNGGIDSAGMPTLAKRKDEDRLEQSALRNAAEQIKQHMEKVAGAGALKDQVDFKVTTEGLRIELVEGKASFFDSGSAVLQAATVKILEVVVREIKVLANDVVVEGHTDSRKYTHGELYGNWELSSDRANAARRIMEQQGLPPAQVKAVRGYADTELRYPDKPLDPRNRRVSIVVRSSTAGQVENSLRDVSSVATPAAGEVVTVAPDAAARPGPAGRSGARVQPFPAPVTGARGKDRR